MTTMSGCLDTDLMLADGTCILRTPEVTPITSGRGRDRRTRAQAAEYAAISHMGQCLAACAFRKMDGGLAVPRSSADNDILVQACGDSSSCFFGIAAIQPDDQGFLSTSYTGSWLDVGNWYAPRELAAGDYTNWCAGEPEDEGRRGGDEHIAAFDRTDTGDFGTTCWSDKSWRSFTSRRADHESAHALCGCRPLASSHIYKQGLDEGYAKGRVDGLLMGGGFGGGLACAVALACVLLTAGGYCRRWRRKLMPTEFVDIGALALALDTARETTKSGAPKEPAAQEMTTSVGASVPPQVPKSTTSPRIV